MVVLAAGSAGARPQPVLPEVLPAAEQARLQPIAAGADVSTRVEAEPFTTRRAVFEYLLDHPVLATHITRALKLARYRISRTPEGLFLDDGWGTTGHFRLVHAAEGTRVFHARGQYKKGVLPSIHGEAITAIEYDLTPRPDGRSLVRSSVTGFVRFDSRVVGMGVQLASAIAQKKADREARRLMRLFAKVSRALEEDAAGVYARVAAAPDVPRRELEELGRLLGVR